MSNNILVQGARVHNLKNIDVNIPRNKFVVITGISGSGKSSLAFDTIYAEGQRRYIETFSAYARQFIGGLERPDVDKIDGLSPVIAIEQKTTSKNPRSTVGTITEIYDYLRLFYSRVGEAFSYNSNEKMISYTDDEIIDLVFNNFKEKKITILSPVVKARKGHYRELFSSIQKQGFLKARIDGVITELKPNLKLDRYKIHDIEIVIDRIILKNNETSKKRLKDSLITAMYHGNNSLLIVNEEDNSNTYYSRSLICPSTGISYEKPEPNSFSFNSPKGMCKKCNGLGKLNKVNIDLVIPDKSISIYSGGLVPLGNYKSSWIFKQIETISERYNFSIKDPISKIPKKAIEIILFGGNESFSVESKSLGLTRKYEIDFEGVIPFIENQANEIYSARIKRWANGFMDNVKCETCNGSRLNKESSYFFIDNKNIHDLSSLDIVDLKNWFSSVEPKLSERNKIIGSEIIKEINKRLDFLLNVGLDYLSLNRPTKSLSGGESQRIRLATQIGSQLVGVLYILDEPSIGLHQRDNSKLIESLKKLRDLGNTIIVVEHDKEIMEKADCIIDVGPYAGKNGGEIIFNGTYKEILKTNTITSQFLKNIKTIPVPELRRMSKNKLRIEGCTGNNLKNIDVDFPLGLIIGVTGVSGSGKSTLINETLYPILNNHFFNGVKEPLPYKNISGLKHIDKVIEINQSPIGRTPRSNPATYTGVYSDIRSLFCMTQESLIRGYKPGRFSFNVVGGRCETCQGGGLRKIEMNFLPDVYINCDDCQGKRFNRETLEIRYKGKSIADILSMTINESCDFFENFPKILRKLKTLKEVGLGYVTLGQQSTTLSGGEAQRIKLASELSKKDTGNTFYILDEPTTGLHFQDIKVLLEMINKLVNKGNTVIIIEHNMDVIKTVDHIIEIGPNGGKLGGQIIFSGKPEDLIKVESSPTAVYLKKELT
ncbi:MAG: excinuclease ABC subunit UvrA [Flavobacteriaceae bacterium]|jgi:excinuclease ABC subunit A|nr:excinuclease ABC subunit UvrA [Flavobacteriaceae bacterium]MBT4960999.1 excinuclease ABC subunit UvrA [Flavobacteriaceae bacterium]MBT5493674.1 excinuclease ABC subunit UvrA [Flavobacteriaceae bacterium]MBT6654576.1 excinuclease ABC subunit UvrA [Flavobacteriaceae bacterium]